MEFNRFDVTTKERVPADESVEVIDSDITTLSASADKVIRVGGAAPFLVNIELQSSYDTTLTRTLWYRQVALDYRHDLPVLTILVLLRKEANSPSLTGVYERKLPDGQMTNRYDYRVVRLWREDAESFLTAGIGLVPLAPLSNVSEKDLPALIHRMADRINREPRPHADKLWTATYLLMGLRYTDDVTFSLLEGVQEMHESTTYQRIMRDGREEGRVLEAQQLVIHFGRKRLPEPDSATIATIEAIKDIDRLVVLIERAVDPEIGDWNELLEVGSIDSD